MAIIAKKPPVAAVPLNPPLAPNGVSSLTLEIQLVSHHPGEALTSRAASRTVIFDPLGWESEIIWQTVESLRTDFAADPGVLIESLQQVLERLRAAP